MAAGEEGKIYSMKRANFGWTATLLIMVALIGGPGQARAANETATATLSMSPRSGTLYKEALRPVDWRAEVAVDPGPGEAYVLPTKFIKATFPREMKFDPGPGTGICPENLIGPPPVNMTVSPEKMIGRCPDALVGNGRARINLAGSTCAICGLDDVVLLAFNGGKNEDGAVELRVYAYSKNAATGLYEEAVLKDGILEMAVPPITGDSSTAVFDLNIPGISAEHPEQNGVDPGFVKATCSTGTWNGHVDLFLGKRDTAGGDLGPESMVTSPEFVTGCVGETGQARAGRLSVAGPAKLKRGRKGTFRVTVRNRGTASISGGKLTVVAPGVNRKLRIGQIEAESSRVVRFKTRFNRKGRKKVRFEAKLRGAGTRSSVKRIKVA